MRRSRSRQALQLGSTARPRRGPHRHAPCREPARRTRIQTRRHPQQRGPATSTLAEKDGARVDHQPENRGPRRTGSAPRAPSVDGGGQRPAPAGSAPDHNSRHCPSAAAPADQDRQVRLDQQSVEERPPARPPVEPLPPEQTGPRQGSRNGRQMFISAAGSAPPARRASSPPATSAAPPRRTMLGRQAATAPAPANRAAG